VVGESVVVAQSEQTKSHFDVAIVGAGIAGATTAIALSRAGLKVCLMDAQTPTFDVGFKRETASGFAPRVSAITPANAEWLNELGVWSLLRPEQVLGYQNMEVWEQLGSGRIRFDAHDYQRQALGYIVENDMLLAACLKALGHEETRPCQRFFGHRIERCEYVAAEQAYQLRLDDERIVNAKLLVGADGANSMVRRILNIPTREWDYDQSAIVCTVRTEQAHQNTAWQRFSEQGPVAYLPLNDTLDETHDDHGHFCSIVWSLDTAKSEEMFALDDTEFSRLLSRELEEQLGEITDISKRFKFPLRQRHAKTYIAKQALLVGDAAHTIHPLAGQGLNLGLSDVKALVDVLQKASDKSYDITHPVLLKQYQRARKTENLSMMLGMEGFKRLFGSTDPLLRWLRNTGVDAMNRHTLIKRQIAQKAMGL